MFRIEICGSIATGKTTLATQLARSCDLFLACEVYRGVPFWEKSCEFPGEYEFERDVSFLLTQAEIIHTAMTQGQNVVCDFAFFQNLAYASLSKQEDISLIAEIYGRLSQRNSPPNALIYLICKAETQVQRMRFRGREPELNITQEYLDALSQATAHQLHTFSMKTGIPVLRIDTDEIAFTRDASQLDVITQRILTMIRNS